jgi:hypothetical protein
MWHHLRKDQASDNCKQSEGSEYQQTGRNSCECQASDLENLALTLPMSVILLTAEWTTQTNRGLVIHKTETCNDMMVNFGVHEWKIHFWNLSVINNMSSCMKLMNDKLHDIKSCNCSAPSTNSSSLKVHKKENRLPFGNWTCHWNKIRAEKCDLCKVQMR